MYKEEEAERAKLMEDAIKLYEKTRELEDNQLETQRRFNVLHEKVLRIKTIIDKRPASPITSATGLIVRESQEFNTT